MKRFLSLFVLVNLVFVCRCGDEGLEGLCSMFNNELGAQLITHCIAELIPKPAVAVIERCVAAVANEVEEGSSVAYFYKGICAARESGRVDEELSSIGECIESTGLKMETNEKEKEEAGERVQACMRQKITSMFAGFSDS